jgi:acetyl-CoA synthetase
VGAHGGYYVAGDGATRDGDGFIWILGRLDDVVNVSGHRLSTIEIESALVAHETVGEAGSAGVADPVTGQAVVAFVTPSGRAEIDAHALRAEVARAIGPVAKPKHVIVVSDLPKTRSGKIMRRLLAQLWDVEQDRRAGRTPQPLGDTTSLQNPWAVDDIAGALAAESRTS